MSAKIEYGLLALLTMAQEGPEKLVKIGTIAGKYDIPHRFLVQILLLLKGAGMCASIRGAAGGYYLIKTAEEIHVGEIISTFKEPFSRARNDGQFIDMLLDHYAESFIESIKNLSLEDILKNNRWRAELDRRAGKLESVPETPENC